MPVTAERARTLALALPDSSEAPHFHLTAFRTPRKIFATLDVTIPRMNLMFNHDLREFYMEQAPDAFEPVPGGWGKNGATLCDLRVVDEALLASALQAAHGLAAPKPTRSSRRTPGPRS